MPLTSLPFDILLSIVENLHPLDIIQLGQTCTIFQVVCEEIAVWVGALRRMHRENAILSGYLDDGGYSLDRLRREATAPSRFIKLMKMSSCLNPILNPVSKHIIPSPNNQPFHRMRLAPGGQILVTTSADSLCIWDLSSNPPLLTVAWDIQVISLLYFSLVNRAQDFRVAIACPSASDDNSPDSTAIRILDYDRSSSTTRTYTGTLNPWSYVDVPLYTWWNNCFFYINEAVLYIWNFQLNRSSRWRVYDGPLDFFVVDHESSNLLVFISHRNIYCYEITEEFSASPQHDSGVVTPLIPKFVFSIPGDMPRDGGDAIRQGLWYKQTHFPLLFDIMFQNTDGITSTFWRYEVILPESGTDSTGRVEFISRDELPVHNGEGTQPFDMVMYQYRVCCGRLFKMFYDGVAPATIKLAFRDDTRTPMSRFDEDPCIEVDLRLPIPLGVKDDDTAAAVDPASGRLCYIADDLCSSIAVVEYLP